MSASARRVLARFVSASSRSILDTEELTMKATSALTELDEKFIGTPDYMGIAYFWNIEYKWELRDASYAQRVKAHKALLKAKLPLDGVSPEHEKIIKAAVK